MHKTVAKKKMEEKEKKNGFVVALRGRGGGLLRRETNYKFVINISLV